MEGRVNLLSDVYVTDQTRVCPRCESGTCDSGPNRGKPCAVDGTVFVAQSFADDQLFKLSKDCPPGGSATATVRIPLALTTGTVGTPGTGGSKPCRENEIDGVALQDNSCGTGGCGGPCA